MATKTRNKSASPVPSLSGTITLDPSPASSALSSQSPRTPLSSLTTILSRDSFPSPPRNLPQQRRSDLAVLNFHNARPAGESSIILPPPAIKGEDSVVHVAPNAQHLPLTKTTEPVARQHNELMSTLPFRDAPSGLKQFALKTSHVDHEKNRSLSIQSLISPGIDRIYEFNGTERGTKRKGSDDRDDDDHMTRSSRGGSVISTSGLSMEDPDVREAVEALGGLKADFTHPPTAPHSPPASTQPEPLLNLIQSSVAVHPLLSTALSISTSTYAASKSYIPPFRYVANTAEGVAGPVVSAVGKRTGIEDYIRRGLTRNRRDDCKGSVGVTKRRKSEKKGEAGNNSQLVEIGQNRETGWQRRLYYSSTGLATALSDDSRRSLKYCLRILFAANANLVKVIETLSSIVDELDHYLKQRSMVHASVDVTEHGIAGYLPESFEQRRQRLADSVDRLKDEALRTLKNVVDTISRYAGGALPEQARDVVKRQILSFPLRWQAAAASSTSVPTTSQPQTPISPPSDKTGGVDNGVVRVAEDDSTPTKGKAVRVLVMAREGLEMMRCVAEVVEGTLASAEEWCDRIGKRRDTDPAVSFCVAREDEANMNEKKGHRRTARWVDAGTDEDRDIVMQEKTS